MSDNPTLEQLLEVQEYFGLPGPALVEKDWYVVKALAAIAAVDTGDFRLVFGGGTALSRAYKLTKRMSEDVDLKIVRDKAPTRGELRKLRKTITDALLGAGFVFDPENKDHRVTMYEGRYTKYQLPYKALAEGKGILRPNVQIETSVWPLRRETVDKSVISFIAEAYGRDPELPKIACSSVLETAAEKFVALTWRAGSELAGLREERDPTLVRHIYDIHMIRDEYDVKEAATLAHEVMLADAATRGDSFPAWKKDPLGETLRAIGGIPNDRVFVDGFANFQRDMVYGDKPDFSVAMGTLNTLADHLKKVPA
ncbi:nucleotidyl transferase AbiEii/AbiGii toxin family protein [Bradyrhizobium sp. 38]|uniref:nucleotidyl transferase AbiEii/AbiGii toxin family protein n=1 Tax=unclassified Bradyrhizobium TaxID=2631580 RepID=UPI001FFB19B0|nr:MULTISPECIES: nucleotidyl transferase AbiEii/AbiGii toxin family protein [unclassified Bradyrhizobium]MCK1340392.1 nucleotidyl transferase AbiEii/AbiGii toxin family protein [Bradyrhizobium sp. 38]MCK1781259.1 nucleotidyl transferase AbiEii/AbiGii toxin family protein [Bradyrhizobium sp. 132]